MADKKDKKEKKRSKKEEQELQLAQYWNYQFKNAMVHKAPFTKRWQEYWQAYYGDYFKNKNLPDYKSDLVSNYIFSTIETIRPIMLDNDPTFQVIPRQHEAMEFVNDLQEVFNYEWDREKMQKKLHRDLITTLVIGTHIYFLPWNPRTKNVECIPVNPFNFFPDPLATCVEDSEFLIYASYKNASLLKRLYPDKADRIQGGAINYGELVQDNHENAQIYNQVLVLEIYTKDYESHNVDEKGNIIQTYPHGRVITLCPELGIVLSDMANPYEDFPFVVLKDYDVPGQFWGEGEVAQLLSPQKYMNELSNAVIDNAKTTANAPWIVDKNSGIGQGQITSRPGLIVRKNPGTEVRREQPAQIPQYVINAVETLKLDMEQVSGVFSSVKGQSDTGVYTAQGILALQEAGQARIRLKVKTLESALGELATAWFKRIKKFWTEDRWIRISRADGSYDFKLLKKDKLQLDYDIRISSGSTMPVNRGAMLDLMLRLAQTQMPDGQTLVDREAVIQYLPPEIRTGVIRRMQEGQTAIDTQLQELAQALQQVSEQLAQLQETSDANDEQAFALIEELTNAVEQINSKILQLEEERAKIEEEQRKAEEIEKIRTEAYNEGYTDAESLIAQETDSEGDESPLDPLEEDAVEPLPDELLQGIEQMSDDELELLIAENPDIVDLINS